MFKIVGIKVLKTLLKGIFISAFLISISYFLLGNLLSTGAFLFNRLLTVEHKETDTLIEIDLTSKRLINYPSYGEVWGTIKIPSINVEALLYHGDSLDLLKKGIGHYSSSYFPGEGGTVILAGHNSDSHFKNIPSLKASSKVIIEAEYGTFTYEVTTNKIVLAEEIENIPITSDEEYLIFYTCYPTDTIGYKQERYIVYAKLVGEDYES